MPGLESNLPRSFGKYTLLRRLGQGGTAEIFLAREKGRSEPLVVKWLLPELTREAQFLAMLLDEAKVASLLNHPSIVRVVDLGREDDHVFLAMEYVPGWNLGTVVRAAGGRLPAPIAAKIALSVADALGYAHRRTDLEGRPLKLVHRDVTPSNIMVSTKGEVKLIDFGVAKAATQLTFTPPGYVKGKFRFMSPEQINQKPLDGRSDIFSLGVALYEISTGLQPFGRAEIVDILKAIVAHQPLPPAGIVPGFPAELQAVIGKAIRKDRERRFSDAESMATALTEALGKMPGCSDVSRYVRDLAAESKTILKPPPTGEPDEVEPTVAMTQSEVARLREADERADAAARALESTQSETDRPVPALRTDTTDPDAPQPTSIVGRPPALPWEDEDASKSPPVLPLQPPLRGPLVPPPLPPARPSGAGVFEVPHPLRHEKGSTDPAWAGPGASQAMAPTGATGRRRRHAARASAWPTIVGLTLLVLAAAAITWLALRQAMLQRSHPPPAPTSTSSPAH